jgi:hypothetical protein
LSRNGEISPEKNTTDIRKIVKTQWYEDLAIYGFKPEIKYTNL